MYHKLFDVSVLQVRGARLDLGLEVISTVGSSFSLGKAARYSSGGFLVFCFSRGWRLFLSVLLVVGWPLGWRSRGRAELKTI